VQLEIVSQLTHEQYEQLERAVTRGQRIAVYRRGTEYIVIPLSLSIRSGREVIEATNPTTGDNLSLYLDELDSIEIVAR
jgi:hypothetical protein